MYDLHRPTLDPALRNGLPVPPSWPLTAAEPVRWAAETGTTLALGLLAPPAPRDDAAPVLVLPGFHASDHATAILRAQLRAAGHPTYGWGLGTNHGLTDEILEGIERRFDEIAAQHPGERIALVGWSFGGLLARHLAHARADRVRQVVCLGSPWRAEGEVTRTTPLFERARRRHGITERADEVLRALRRPLPVPCTAVFSRSDGIVPWEGCAVEADRPARAENVALVSSHVGLVSNPLALTVLLDRLSQDPEEWQPFDWRRSVTARLRGVGAGWTCRARPARLRRTG